MLDMAGPEPEAPASEGTPPAQLGLSWFPQGGAFANFAPPPACTSPPLCTESSTCAPSPRRRPPARSTPSSTISPCTESSTCALSLRCRMPARSTPSPTSSVHTICPSVRRHDRSLRHFKNFTPAKSGLDVFDLGVSVPAACAVNRAPRSTQLPAAQRTLGGIALGDGGDCGWPASSAAQRSGEASALGGGCGDGGDCVRLSGVAEWRFGEASTLDGRRLRRVTLSHLVCRSGRDRARSSAAGSKI